MDCLSYRSNHGSGFGLRTSCHTSTSCIGTVGYAPHDDVSPSVPLLLAVNGLTQRETDVAAASSYDFSKAS